MLVVILLVLLLVVPSTSLQLKSSSKLCNAQPKNRIQMHSNEVHDIKSNNIAKVMAILSLTIGLYTNNGHPNIVFAATSTTTEVPKVKELSNLLNDYKEKTIIDSKQIPAVVVPTTTPPVVKKVIPPPPVIVKKVIPSPEVITPKASTTATPPTAAVPPSAPLIYKINPDTELLKRLEATKKTKIASKLSTPPAVPRTVQTTPIATTPSTTTTPVVSYTKNTVIKNEKKIENKSEKKTVVVTDKITEKVKVPPAVAKQVSTSSSTPNNKPAASVSKAEVKVVSKKPILGEEKNLVEAFNKKSNTNAKITQVNINLKQAKIQIVEARHEMKKSENKINDLNKKINRNGIDRDLKRSAQQDKNDEEKIFNEVCNYVFSLFMNVCLYG